MQDPSDVPSEPISLMTLDRESVHVSTAIEKTMRHEDTIPSALSSSDTTVVSDSPKQSPFPFTATDLSKLHDPKDLGVLRDMGGVDGLVIGLRTNITKGLHPHERPLKGTVTMQEIWQYVQGKDTDHPVGVVGIQGRTSMSSNLASIDDENIDEFLAPSFRRRSTFTFSSHAPPPFVDRRRIFAENRIPSKKSKNLFQFMWNVLKDKLLVLLSVAAIVSLGLGFYQSFRPGSTDRIEWVQGVAILVAVIIITFIQGLNDYQKERKFVALNAIKESRDVKVIRGGKTILINMYDVVVGDIMHIEAGDVVSTDGVLLDGYNILCDESSATGETDALQKVPAAVALANTPRDTKFSEAYDPFILSGSKVLEGVGNFLVTAVGPNSFYGRTLMALREGEEEDTPLQLKLNKVVSLIMKAGSIIAGLLFIILLIKFLAQLPGSHLDPPQKGQQFIQILIISVVVLVIAVPEGLPLAVTLALAYATSRMLKDRNLVRVLKACETMGNATCVCSDKTGTLTQNKMTVVAGTLGVSHKFGQIPPRGVEDIRKLGDETNSVPEAEFFDKLPMEMKDLIRQSVAVNSTAFEAINKNGAKEFIGSKTETALLDMARKYIGMSDVSAEREQLPAVEHIPFASERKCVGTIGQYERSGRIRFRLFISGASEIILRQCDRVVDMDKPSTNSTPLSESDHASLNTIIDNYASHALRTIALSFRDFDQWPPAVAGSFNESSGRVEFQEIFQNMTWIGVIGIQDPLRPGVTDAVRACQKAGVVVRMVTGDNLATAKAIARESGILNMRGIAMEGPEFRNLNSAEKDEIIPRLRVLARSSPQDKCDLVKRLKELGQTVAVTGDGTNDAPALKIADVGFSMGIAGTEVAKEASDIILMDDDFSSIVQAILWGRCISDAIKKFLQFQLTVNVSAVLLAFISCIASGDEESVLTAVQLLWINLIQDTFAALALATDPPNLELLNRNPEPKSASIISLDMWKMILGQSIFQLIITLVLAFAGSHIFTDWDTAQINTIVFNTYVWLQVFNQFNCRRIDNHLNVFSGLHHNLYFILITLITVGGQIIIIFVGGTPFSVVRLNGAQWALSIILGLLSIPVGVIVRLLPNRVVKRCIPRKLVRKVFKTTHVDSTDMEPPADGHELLFLKQIRSQSRLSKLGHSPKLIRQESRKGTVRTTDEAFAQAHKLESTLPRMSV